MQIPPVQAKPNKSVFDQLPDSGFVREVHLVRKRSDPDSTALLPFGSNTLWRMVNAGTFPAPIKLAKNCTCWHVGTVRAWLIAQAAR